MIFFNSPPKKNFFQGERANEKKNKKKFIFFENEVQKIFLFYKIKISNIHLIISNPFLYITLSLIPVHIHVYF